MEQRWFDRTFDLGLPPAAAPALIERLRRTADRLATATGGLSTPLTTHRQDGRWSINENVGHLLDLESLWAGRIDDLDRGAAVLAAADLENRKTHEARHNDRSLTELLEAFRAARGALLQRLERTDEAALSRTAKHPRLGQPMSVVDLCFFIAEHDDHHFATIDRIAQDLAGVPVYAIDLLNTVERAVPVLLAMDDHVTGTRPAPGKWSARELIGHLVDSASNNHQRFVRAIFRDDLTFEGYAQDEWVTAQRYQEAHWRELVSLWAHFNRHLGRLMSAIPPQARTRPRARHNLDQIAFVPVSAQSPVTLEAFMADYVAHLQHHLRQIDAVTESLR